MAENAQVYLEQLQGIQPSKTVVFRSALHLVAKLGLTASQIIAFLHFARWVQSLKIAEWVASNKLAMKSPDVEVFQMLILGAGGCGKSTLLLVAEVFVRFWLGSDVARKVAIANSAARKFGGDTMHALLNLPMSYIGERKSLLKGDTLQQFRKLLDAVKVLFVDECSMVVRAQWYQADLRLKQAKREFIRRFGGMDIVTTGDLLQLPPVKRASVCDPMPEKSSEAPTDEADTENNQKKRKMPAELRHAENL